MGQRVDLDTLLLSEAAVAAINELAARLALAAGITGGAKKEEDLPDLEAEIEDDGTLTIIFDVPIGDGRATARLALPPGHWGHMH